MFTIGSSTAACRCIDLVSVDDHLGEFICRVEPAVTTNFDARSSSARPPGGSGGKSESPVWGERGFLMEKRGLGGPRASQVGLRTPPKVQRIIAGLKGARTRRQSPANSFWTSCRICDEPKIA